MSHISEAVGMALEGVSLAFKAVVVVAIFAVGSCTVACGTVAYFVLSR